MHSYQDLFLIDILVLLLFSILLLFLILIYWPYTCTDS